MDFSLIFLVFEIILIESLKKMSSKNVLICDLVH